MKIQIIGYSGSGKSTLAKTLANHYDLPLLYLDNVQFYGDWQTRSKEEQTKIVREFLHRNPSGWVIDGNYSDIAPERFTDCDLVFFLNYNRFFCYKESKKRYKENLGKRRESCPCIEKFDLEFRNWLIFSGRTRKRKKLLLENFSKCLGTKLKFNSRKALSKYLRDNNITFE